MNNNPMPEEEPNFIPLILKPRKRRKTEPGRPSDLTTETQQKGSLNSTIIRQYLRALDMKRTRLS